MNILQVSTTNRGGGAHMIAGALHRGFRARGHASAMVVGRRRAQDPSVYEIPIGISSTRHLAYRAGARLIKPILPRVPTLRPVHRALRSPNPIGYLQAYRAGREFFDYPGSHALLGIAPFAPEIVHCHNLHRDYFDLRSLASLSHEVPVALTLHDEWTFTGHCAYGMTCERWRTGCGACPDLTIYPAIHRDGTRENWRAKQAIYSQSRLYVTAPSRWLLDRAQQSMLAGGAADWRLIPNGVDQQVFRPADQAAARDLLGLPAGHLILLFTANAVPRNRFKDYDTVARAVERVAAAHLDRRLLLIALGGAGPTTRVGNAELRFVPYETEPARVAAYYQAADVYLHAANADTFPTTVLEALSVGRPIVATAVGGIDEQVRSLEAAPGSWAGASEGPATATGVLVAAHDDAAMAAATAAILADDELRAQLGRNAASDAAARFGVERQLDATLAWYGESIQDWRRWRQAVG